MTEKKLKEVYPAFVYWNSIPPEQRDPKSKEEFCKKYNIEKSDITLLYNMKEFDDDLEISTLKWGRNKLPEILHILYNKIKEHQNSNDIRTFKELVSPVRQEPLGSTTYNLNVINPTDDQYKQIIEREAKILSGGRTTKADKLLPSN